jgi:hypothetical protein
MFRQLQRWFHFYFLKKGLRQHVALRKTVNLADSNEIGILFDATDPDKVTLINQFAESLKKEKKHVVLLGYYDQPKRAINFNFAYFNRKNLNWHLQPTGDVITEFLNRRFDILINAYAKENLPLEYMSAMSHAAFRMGAYNKEKTYAYDFMVDMKEEEDLRWLLNQYRHYLQMF